MRQIWRSPQVSLENSWLWSVLYLGAFPQQCNRLERLRPQPKRSPAQRCLNKTPFVESHCLNPLSPQHSVVLSLVMPSVVEPCLAVAICFIGSWGEESCPLWLLPKQCVFAFKSNAQQWLFPHDSCIIGTPPGRTLKAWASSFAAFSPQHVILSFIVIAQPNPFPRLTWSRPFCSEASNLNSSMCQRRRWPFSCWVLQSKRHFIQYLQLWVHSTSAVHRICGLDLFVRQSVQQPVCLASSAKFHLELSGSYRWSLCRCEFW